MAGECQEFFNHNLTSVQENQKSQHNICFLYEQSVKAPTKPKHNLFFVQLKHLNSTFTFGKKMKILHPFPLIKKSTF